MFGDCLKLTKQQRAKLEILRITANTSIAELIGTPAPNHQELKANAVDIQKRIFDLEREPTRHTKKVSKLLKKELKNINRVQLPQATKRYEAHDKLFNDISDWVLKLSATTGFAVHPDEYLLILNSQIRRQFGMPFANMNNNFHVNQIRGMSKQLAHWKKKIGKYTGTNIFNKSFQDIWKFISTKDSSGLGFKVVEYAARLPDATWNTAYSYLDRFEEAISGFRDNIDSWTSPKHYSSYLFSDETAYHTLEDGTKIPLEKFEEQPLSRQKEAIYDKYETLIRDVMDGRVRYVVPKLIPYGKKEEGYSEWAKTDDGKAVLRYVHDWAEPHRFHHIIGKDGRRYTYVMVDKESDSSDDAHFNSYIVSVADQQFDEAGAPLKGRRQWKETKFFIPIEKHFEKNPNKIAGYNSNSLDISGLAEGFFEADPVIGHRPFNYPMRNQKGKPIKGTNLTSYHNFSRMDKQPDNSIINKKGSPIETTVGNRRVPLTFWERVRIERGILADVGSMAGTETQAHGQNINEWVGKVKEHALKVWGMDKKNSESVVDEIISMGQMHNNLWEGKSGRLFTGNMFMNLVKRKYDPRIFLNADIWDDMDKAVIDLRKERSDITADINTARAIIDERVEESKAGLPPTTTDAEFLDATKREAGLKEAYIKAGHELDNIEIIRQFPRPDTPDEIQKVRIATQAYHLKSRKPFTNALNRQRDNKTIFQYVNSTSRSLHFDKLKLQLLKALTHIDNPEVAQFLINRVKIGTGMLDYDTNFMGIDVSNRVVANSLNKVAGAFGKKTNLKASNIHFMGVMLNSFITSNLLGTWGALNNNTQRLTFMEEYGLKPWKWAGDKMDEPGFKESDLYKAVRKVGTLDPLTAFGDLLVGATNDSPRFWTHRIKPNLAMVEVQLTKSKFIRQKTSIFDSMLRQTHFTKEQKRKLQAIKKYRTEIDKFEENKILKRARGLFHDALSTADNKIFSRRVKQLNGEITRDEINKLVSWKLRGMLPIFGLKTDNPLFTFQGGELDMRTQGTLVGFYLSDELDLLDEESNIPKYEQQAAADNGRMVVYNTMFGMSLQHLPDGFGGIMKTLLQYKPYQYHEFEREYRLIENFLRSNERQYHSVRRLTGSFFNQFIPSMKGKSYGDKNVDELANRTVRFLETRAMATALTVGAFWSPFAKGFMTAVHHAFGDPNVPMLGQKVTRAYESPLVSIAMKFLLTLGWAVGWFSPARRKKMDEWWEQIAYLFFPPLLSWIIMIPEWRRAFKPLIPLYDEVVEPAAELYDYATDPEGD